MSFSLSRVSSARVAVFLTCVLTLAAAGGCVQRSAGAYEQRMRSFPGVAVTRTQAGGFSMRILSGLVGAGQPLYIIDNERVTVEPSRGIDWLQLEDIVRVKVLKGPVETNVFGQSGVNGVILITTKQAMRARK